MLNDALNVEMRNMLKAIYLHNIHHDSVAGEYGPSDEDIAALLEKVGGWASVKCPPCKGTGRDHSDILDDFSGDTYEQKHPDCERCGGDGLLYEYELFEGAD